MEDNKGLMEKLKELENDNRERMSNQIDAIIWSNREQNRTKCLDMAITSLKTKEKELEYREVTELADRYYRWICEKDL